MTAETTPGICCLVSNALLAWCFLLETFRKRLHYKAQSEASRSKHWCHEDHILPASRVTVRRAEIDTFIMKTVLGQPSSDYSLVRKTEDNDIYLINHQSTHLGSKMISCQKRHAFHSVFQLRKANRSFGSIWMLDMPWPLSAQARVAECPDYFTEIGKDCSKAAAAEE